MEVLSGYVMVVWNIDDHLRDIPMKKSDRKIQEKDIYYWDLYDCIVKVEKIEEKNKRMYISALNKKDDFKLNRLLSTSYINKRLCYPFSLNYIQENYVSTGKLKFLCRLSDDSIEKSIKKIKILDDDNN